VEVGTNEAYAGKSKNLLAFLLYINNWISFLYSRLVLKAQGLRSQNQWRIIVKSFRMAERAKSHSHKEIQKELEGLDIHETLKKYGVANSPCRLASVKTLSRWKKTLIMELKRVPVSTVTNPCPLLLSVAEVTARLNVHYLLRQRVQHHKDKMVSSTMKCKRWVLKMVMEGGKCRWGALEVPM
jgi:hypothetical protein